MAAQSIELPESVHKSEITKLFNIIEETLSKKELIQFIILCAASFCVAAVGINDSLTIVHTYTPSYYCPDYNKTNNCDFENGTCPSGFVFNENDDYSPAVEWSLVCDKKFLTPLIATLYFAGAGIGTPLFGYVGDKWGRKFSMLITIHIQTLVGFSIYFVNNLDLFLVLRTIQGGFIHGTQVNLYTYIQEYSPTSYRAIFGSVSDIGWSSGFVMVGIFAYFLPNWRDVQLYSMIPTIFVLCIVWLLPESLLWMYANKREKAAYNVCVRLAKYNRNKERLNALEQITPEKLKSSASSVDVELEKESTHDEGVQLIILQIIKTPCLLKHMIIMFFVWFSIPMVFLGILYFLPNLSGDRHINFIASNSIEMFGYLVTIVIFTKIGRRLPTAIFEIIAGISVIALGVLVIYMPNDSEYSWVQLLLVIFSKGICVSLYSGMAFYTCELFPTTTRGVAMGVCMCGSTIGSLVAPYILIIVDYTSPVVPLSGMGIVLICVGIAAFSLPETVNTELPNTVEEAVERWGKK